MAQTWKKVLYVDDNTGATDLVIDPMNPQILYAATYQRQRKAWGFNGGGPGSAIYKTTDGGATWTKLTNGLPAGDKGRIGIDLFPSDSRVVYATVEAAAGASGVYRTVDGGASWEKLSSLNTRPMYYSQIRLDPKDRNRVYMLGSNRGFYFSDDGGKTFTERFSNIHSEDHALWVDPDDPEPPDRRRRRRRLDLVGPRGHVGLPPQHADRPVLRGGRGQQGAVHRVRRTAGQRALVRAERGAQPERDRGPRRLEHRRRRRLLREDRSVRPELRVRGIAGRQRRPREPHDDGASGRAAGIGRAAGAGRAGAAAEADTASTGTRRSSRPRFDAKTVYMGANVLFKSTDRGSSWKAISPDLTLHIDRDTLTMMGARVGPTALSRNDGVTSYGTITSVSESPMDANVLYGSGPTTGRCR